MAEEDSKGDEPTRVALLQIVTAIKFVGGSKSGFLIYVLFFVNGRKLSALLDIGATHTFV